MKTLGAILIVIVAMTACQTKKKDVSEKHAALVQELKAEKEAMEKTISVVHHLLDSIEQAINDPGKAVSPEKDPHRRLRNVHLHILKQEAELRKTKNKADAYLMMMDALKSEADIRESHIQMLSDSITRITIPVSANLRSHLDAGRN